MAQRRRQQPARVEQAGLDVVERRRRHVGVDARDDEQEHDGDADVLQQAAAARRRLASERVDDRRLDRTGGHALLRAGAAPATARSCAAARIVSAAAMITPMSTVPT